MKAKILAVAAVSLMLGACAATGAVSLFKDIKVNGDTVSAAFQKGLYDDLIASGQPESPQLLDVAKKMAIERTALVQEAHKLKIDKDPVIQRQIDNARVSILVNRLNSDFLKANPVTDAEIQAAYEKAKEEYGDSEFHMRRIFFKDEAKARDALAKLTKSPGKFQSFAKQSDDKTMAEKGGDMGWVSPSVFKDKREIDMVKATKAGTVAPELIHTNEGWHLLKVDGVRKAQNFPTLEKTKDSLAQQLARLKAAKNRADIVKRAVVTEN